MAIYSYFLVRVLIVSSLIVLVSISWIHPDFAIADRETTNTHTQQREPFRHDPETWERLARDGDTEAQFVLGLLHSDGAGVPLNYEQAFYWYHEAAQKDHVDAQYNLAHLYLNGNGVKKDLAQAVHWWQQAAENGHVRAQYNLGFAYFRGIGVEQDHQQALLWVRRAARRNDERALKLLTLLESGVASSPDPPARALDSVRGTTTTGRKRADAASAVDAKQAPPASSSTAGGTTMTGPQRVDAASAVDAKQAPPASSSTARGTEQVLDAADNDPWLYGQPAKFFTAQLLSSTKISDVAAYIAQRQLQGKVQVFRTTRNGEDWWYLLFGSYATRDAARAAITAMNIEPKSAWIRRFGSLQKNRCQTLAAAKVANLSQFCP